MLSRCAALLGDGWSMATYDGHNKWCPKFRHTLVHDCPKVQPTRSLHAESAGYTRSLSASRSSPSSSTNASSSLSSVKSTQSQGCNVAIMWVNENGFFE